MPSESMFLYYCPQCGYKAAVEDGPEWPMCPDNHGRMSILTSGRAMINQNRADSGLPPSFRDKGVLAKALQQSKRPAAAAAAVPPVRRPRLFVGSSVEGMDVARAIQDLLDRDCEVQIWSQGTFELGGTTLESLARALGDFDFAVMVVSPDDMTITREVSRRTTRDNVILELGMFIGALGRHRTFMVWDRTNRPDLPSDLAGVTAADYQPHSNGNFVAALGPACNKVRDAIKRLGLIERAG